MKIGDATSFKVDHTSAGSAPCTMFYTCLTLALLSLAIFDASKARLQRPFLLEVHRDHVSHKCSFLSMHETQPHKSLLDNRAGFVLEEGNVYSGVGAPMSDEKYLQFYAHDVELLWAKAEALCGSQPTWSFPAYVAARSRNPRTRESQAAFQTEIEQPILSSTLPKPPQLEIIPLITTGDSSNRIDMVFFSDGCELLSSTVEIS